MGQNFSVHRLACAAEAGADDGTDTVRMRGFKGVKRFEWLSKTRLRASIEISLLGPAMRYAVDEADGRR